MKKYLLYIFLFGLSFSLSLPVLADEEVWRKMNMDAIVLFGEGKREQAVVGMQKAILYAEENFGRDSVQVAKSMNNLGNLSLQLGFMGRAEAEYSKAIEISKRLLGENDPMVADSLFNLAMVRVNRGNKPGARKILTRAREIYNQNPKTHQEALQRVDSLLQKVA